LVTLPFVRKVWPSQANFLLTQVSDATRLVAHCRDRGVLVRNFAGKAGVGEAVRFSVGTPAQVDRLLEVLEGFA
ncbi:MAG: histidinol-phosphate transaminase, partial [Pseudomonadota bacterium]